MAIIFILFYFRIDKYSLEIKIYDRITQAFTIRGGYRDNSINIIRLVCNKSEGTNDII